MLRSLFLALALAVTFTACNSDHKQQQPTAEEQKRLQGEQQKANEQQKQLTSGYGKSMQYTPPSTGYNPKTQGTKAQKQRQKPTQQQSPQQ